MEAKNSTVSFLTRTLDTPHLGCWFQTQRHSRQYQSPHCPGALQPLFGILRHSPKSVEERPESEAPRLVGTTDARSESRILCWCDSLFQLKTYSFCSRTAGNSSKHWELEITQNQYRDINKFFGTNLRILCTHLNETNTKTVDHIRKS